MFLTEKFNFNGKNSSELNLCLCDFNNDILNEIGFEFRRTLTKNENFINNPMYDEEKESDYEIELNLLLYDSDKKTKLIWTNDVIKQVYDFLITDNFCEFYTEDNQDVVYYFKVTSIQKVFTPNREGYLKVTFKSLDEYCYIKKTFTTTVNGNTTLSVPNPSNDVYKPIIKIINNGNTSTVNKINNLQIVGANNKDKITIDNLICTVECNGVNAFSYCNRKWVSLAKGNNTLKISGNMTVSIECLFPIIM